jgi:hypothetical protein
LILLTDDVGLLCGRLSEVFVGLVAVGVREELPLLSCWEVHEVGVGVTVVSVVAPVSV